MKLRFLAFFIVISFLQAISASDFNVSFTSEDRVLNQTNVQKQEFHETFHQNIKDAMRLAKKVEERKNEEKYELPDASRKAQRGRASGVSGGGANINRRPRSRNSAPSVLLGLHFWVSTFSLCATLAFIFVFPF